MPMRKSGTSESGIGLYRCDDHPEAGELTEWYAADHLRAEHSELAEWVDHHSKVEIARNRGERRSARRAARRHRRG